MQIAKADLESWMREYYFSTELDLGSSGVENFSFAEIRSLLAITQDELDEITFHDSRTQGDPCLLRTISERWFGGDAESVMATHGSSEAIFLSMQALLQPGDEVIVLRPCYQQLYSIAESIGCQVKFWGLPFEQQFHPDVDDLKKLMTRQTKMVVVNFPHNPTGATLSLDEQAELIRVVSTAGAYLLWDSAFRELVYTAPPLPEPGLQYDRTISLGTLSKAYGLPGLRVGWCLAEKTILEQFAHIRDYITLHLSPLVEFVAMRAIAQADKLLELRLSQARKNLQLLGEWIERHGDQLEWVPPAGGVCSFVRFSQIDDTEPFCRTLGHEYKTLLVPGKSFHAPAHVRLGFGGPTADLIEGLSRFSTLLRKMS